MKPQLAQVTMQRLTKTNMTSVYKHLNYTDPLTVRGPANNSSKVDCHYSDWSSCSYYCGEPKVETKYKTLVGDSNESRSACPLLEELPCETIACTGNSAEAYKN